MTLLLLFHATDLRMQVVVYDKEFGMYVKFNGRRLKDFKRDIIHLLYTVLQAP